MTETFTKIPADVLAEWVAEQRWYGSKGRTPTLEVKGAWRLAAGDADVLGLLLIDRSGALPVLYQVPLSYRRSAIDDLGHALVASVDIDGESFHVYDAPHDPAFATALVGLMASEGSTPDAGNVGGARAYGHRQPGATTGTIIGSHVLRGEQSNTSIIVDLLGADGLPERSIICKLFRALHNGDNPDVTVQSALGAAGSTLVPASIGSITGEWDDSGEQTGRAYGHLMFAQEFLPGVEDAWRVALESVRAGADFTAQAYELGRATAEVHATLARVLPTIDATSDVVSSVVATMRRRHSIAVREVPEVAVHSEAIDRVYAAAETTPWPRLQRIHGDYHLGQVLAVPGRGWVLLDFEGEPLRPMNERRMPDVILRDVAGMLRSFDYAAGAYERETDGEDRSGWARDTRRAFVDGYIATSGFDLREHRTVLDAFEIDKAVYEAIYEARNRPEWLSIPTSAIARLVRRSASSAADSAPSPSSDGSTTTGTDAPRSDLDPVGDFTVPEDADLHVPEADGTPSSRP